MRRLIAGLVIFAMLPTLALAQSPPCGGGVCVGYAIVTQAVPISTAAIGMLALMLLLLAYMTLRGKLPPLAGLFVGLGLVGMANLGEVRNAYANGYNIHFNTGNPAYYAYPGIFEGGMVSVQNNLTASATITSISIAAPYIENPYPNQGGSTCYIGLVLPPDGTCQIRLEMGQQPT
jgi:hypothetical protein